MTGGSVTKIIADRKDCLILEGLSSLTQTGDISTQVLYKHISIIGNRVSSVGS